MVEISTTVLSLMRGEGERAYPSECCGALVGTLSQDGETREVSLILPISNSREQSEQYHRFAIEAEDLLHAENTARKLGLEVLGFYHSHPDAPAQPSEYDRNAAFPFYSYIILAVERGRAAAITSWRLSLDRAFQPEIIKEV